MRYTYHKKEFLRRRQVKSPSRRCCILGVILVNAPSHLLMQRVACFSMQCVAIYEITLLSNGRVASQNNAQRVA